MFLTVDEALGQVEMPRNTLLRNLKSGELRGFQTPQGEWLVDAEPLMVDRFHYLKAQAHPTLNLVIHRDEGPGKIARLEELLERERQRSADLQVERDRWAAHAERLTAMVETLAAGA